MICEVAGAHGGEYVMTLILEAVSTSENVGKLLPDYTTQQPRRQQPT
jgi:hypothetical protein